MNITSEKEMIFRKDWEDGKTTYQIGLSNKKQDGNYENGYMLVRFKKGTELPNQTKIKIKGGWISFYKDKDKHTIPYIFINDFDLVDNNVNQDDLPF